MAQGILRGRGRSIAALSLACGLLGGAPLTLAQYGNNKGNARDPNAPAAIPDAGKGILERRNPKELTLHANVTLRLLTRDEQGNSRKEAGDFQTAAVVFPVLKNSASHVGSQASGTLKVDGNIVADSMETLTGYPSGTELGKWKFKDTLGSTVMLDVNIPVTCYRTTFNEAAANKLDWPKEWPAEAKAAMEKQWYIELGAKGPIDMKPVKDLITRWTNGKDPKALPPAKLAKFLAGQTAQMVQISGNGVQYNRNSEVEGVDVRGAIPTLETGRGSEFDMVCLLAAVYRQAGIPARTVFGFEWDGSKSRDRLFAKKGVSQYRPWVEFALVDPANAQQVIWVPVDVVQLRKSSSRAGDMERPWKWFGSCDDFDGVVPFAFQLIPPTDVVSHGSPAFYGWMVTPKPPDNVVQSIRIDVGATPQGGDNGVDNNKGMDTPQPDGTTTNPTPQKPKKKNPYGH
jgi:hypothetical protein